MVGCGSIASFWGKEDESVLLSVFVLPELHGNGIGTQIINALENDEYFKRAKRVEVPSSITAYDFYRKFGYLDKNGVKELDNEGNYKLEKFWDVNENTMKIVNHKKVSAKQWIPFLHTNQHSNTYDT